jgi:hypothetical protein
LDPAENSFFRACLSKSDAGVRDGPDPEISEDEYYLAYARDEIESIYESEWYQGFGSECKEHLGQDKNGYYYALEIGDSESDLSWHGPYETRDGAEQGLSEAFDLWDERTGAREQAWEDQQIAQFEQEHEEIER